MPSIPAESAERLFGASHAFDHPLTIAVCALVVAGLAVSGIAIAVLGRTGRISEDTSRELQLRWQSWCWLAPCMIVPVLLGAFWTILAVLLLSLLSYREYARATGAFRERTISIVVVVATLVLNFAALDHFDRLFFACGPLGVALIVMATIPADRPQGFIQRIGLGALGYLLFCFSLGYLSILTNLPDFRPLLLLILTAVSLNDVFAYCCGKLIGGPRLLPATSPKKTVAGALGALVLTTLLVAVLGKWLYAGTPLDDWPRLALLGALISGLGQLGDLTLSSVKRDLGVKDVSRAIPGHGGLLDRFDSLLLVPPAVYHYLSLVLGPLGNETPARILTGAG
jgi:phosphatidate cytidylyltransferase